jgi:sulfofructose kinase
MREILGLGGVAYDQIAVVPDIPRWESVSYIDEYQVQQGGMVATAMVAASRLGAPAEFVGGIGNDPQGEYAKANFARNGVACDRMRVFEDGSSAFTIVLVQKSTGSRTFIHNKGVQARSELLDGDVDLSGVRYVLFDGFYFDTAVRTATAARRKGIVSVTDMSPGNRNPGAPGFLELIDYPILSEIFIRSHFGTDDALGAGKKLFGKSNKALLVTCSERGVHIITAGGVDHVPAFGVKVVDTTGAGDVFHGAFLFCLWKGYDLRRAVQFSSAVSALKCTKMGGQRGIPTFAETREFLARELPETKVWI